MSPPRLVATLKHPGVAPGRIGENLPTVVIGIPEIEAVCAMLKSRLGYFVQLPNGGVSDHEPVDLVDLLVSLNIDAVMTEHSHGVFASRLDAGVTMSTPQSEPDGYVTGLYDFKAQELFIEFSCEGEITAFKSSV
jgi:hypothetical protein